MWLQTEESDESIVFFCMITVPLHTNERWMIQSHRITFGQSLMSLSPFMLCLSFVLHRYSVSYVFTHISVHFTLQLKLCCANSKENTMNRTENHYHSILFGEFFYSSTFFAMKTFQLCFPHICSGVFFLLFVWGMFFFISLKCWNESAARGHVHRAFKLKQMKVCDSKTSQRFANTLFILVEIWLAVEVFFSSFANMNNSLAFNIECSIVFRRPMLLLGGFFARSYHYQFKIEWNP